MPLITEGYQSPTNMPTGLVLPGQGPVMPQQPQREMTLGEMGGVGLQGIAAALSIPRLMAWNVGPALVGRPGEGPQTGADLLGRLGMNQDSALTHALGAGLEMVADPVNLFGMGMARPGASVNTRPLLESSYAHMDSVPLRGYGTSANPLASSARGYGSFQAPVDLPGGLGQTLREGSQDVASQMAARGAPAPISWPRQPVPAPARPGPSWGGQLDPASFGQAPGVSPGWLQRPPPPGGYPNFPTPLISEQFLAPAASSTTAPAGRTLLDRLQRVAQPPQQAGPINY